MRKWWEDYPNADRPETHRQNLARSGVDRTDRIAGSPRRAQPLGSSKLNISA
jgi:hypothetical protein